MHAARMKPDVGALFSPSRIALVGASDRSGWSWNVFNNLESFDGEVVCVNPRATTVHGVPAVASIAAADADLAFVMVPRQAVLETIAEAADAGVRNVVLLTDGFAEAGEEGIRRQSDVVDLCQQRGITMLGPNGIGFINATDNVRAFGLPVKGELIAGGVGLVLQSGGLSDAVMNLAQANGLGISHLVSIGNEAMVGITDVVDFLIDDPATRVIGLFVEAFRRPAEFVRVAERAMKAGKPIVVLKVGRSEASARSAMAHTGALVGDDRTTDAVFRQQGVLRAGSLEDLVTTLGVLSTYPLFAGARGAFVTGSGGACDIAADRCHDEGIVLPELSERTVERLREILPPGTAVRNPLDVTGYVIVSPVLLPRALAIVAEDENVDFVVCTMVPEREPAEGGALAPAQDMDALSRVAREASVPIVFMDIAAIDITQTQQAAARDAGVPVHVGGLDRGIGALGQAARWSEVHRRHRAQNGNRERAKVTAVLPAPAGQPWSEHDALRYLESAGLPIPEIRSVTTAAAAVEAADHVGYPVVMKIASADIAHKSDVGGVKLGLAGPDEVSAAFIDITERIAVAAPQARVDGVLVAEMSTDGIDLFVGIISDPQWGKLLAVGLGGIWIEVLKDSSTRMLPASRADVQEMLAELRGVALLDGARGSRPADRESLIDAILCIADAAIGLGDALEVLEVNPLRIDGHEVVALDALVTWQEARTSGD